MLSGYNEATPIQTIVQVIGSPRGETAGEPYAVITAATGASAGTVSRIRNGC